MRLVGLALLAGWLVAWSVAPRGAPLRSAAIVAAVACAGGDTAAAAWLERPRGGVAGDRLHVVIVDEQGRIGDRLQLVVDPDAIGYRLVAAGGGRFVLAAEHRDPLHHWYELHRFGAGRHEVLPRIPAHIESEGWQLAASGDEIVLTDEVKEHRLVIDDDNTGDDGEVVLADQVKGETVARTLGADGAWQVTTAERILVGDGGEHVVRYEEQHRAAHLEVGPGRSGGWNADPGRGRCRFTPATAISVVGLRGGYARLLRHGDSACVEGIRDGAPFETPDMPLRDFSHPRLVVDMEGRLSIQESQEAQLLQQRWQVPLEKELQPLLETTRLHPLLAADGIKYRLYAGEGKLGVTDLATRVTRDEIQVLLERQGVGQATVLSPTRQFEPDYRPLLRRLGLLPLLCLLISCVDALRLRQRLRQLRPVPVEALLTPGGGPITLQGTLMVEGDAPTMSGPRNTGGAAPLNSLRVRCGRHLVTVFVEGARILRASQLRPVGQPRGDAVDVAAGAAVVASGRLEQGTLYRDETRLRAGRDDLVMVGCGLTEAQAFAGRVLRTTVGFLVGAAGIVLLVSLGG